MASRAYDITATNVLTAVPNYDTISYNENVSVENNSSSKIELYWGQILHPDVISSPNTFRAYDNFTNQGQLYVKAITGAGGNIVVHVWKRVLP